MADSRILPIVDPPEPPLGAAAPAPGSRAAGVPDAKARPARYLTLGCKVNQYETEYVRELLAANGYRDARPGEPAELAVINTCTVTAESDRKSRRLVRQVSKANPGVQIVVMGCYATADPAAVARLPGVVKVVVDKRDLAGAFESFGVRRRIAGIRDFQGRHRAFVKVQDGCLLDCTFCIIPKVRPHLVSRPVEDVAAEVRGLVDAGFGEIVLTGIHLGHYGIDSSRGRPRSEWRRLWHLLDRLCALPGDFRIRLSSLEVAEVTDDFIAVLRDQPRRICPHLHLSLQSGSDAVLGRMRRRYRIGRFLERCDRLRAQLDEPAFTTDVIVGFPGETDAEFDQTVAAVREAGFSKIHIFPFSPRQGTAAMAMTDRVDESVVRRRRETLADVGRDLAQSYYHRLLGRTLEMLIETPDPDQLGVMRGTACRYAPLRLRAIGELAGRLVPVVARRIEDEAVIVEPAFDSDRPQPWN